MRLIQTIRLFKGKFVSIDFPERKYNAIPHRIAMKLRELGYSLDGFDHLYINFTVDAVENGMEFSKYIDSFHPWFRIYNIQVSEALFDTLESPESYDAILSLIESALVRISPKDEDLVHRAVAEALEQGEQMLMLRKQKITSIRRAAVYLLLCSRVRYTFRLPLHLFQFAVRVPGSAQEQEPGMSSDVGFLWVSEAVLSWKMQEKRQFFLCRSVLLLQDLFRRLRGAEIFPESHCSIGIPTAEFRQ